MYKKNKQRFYRILNMTDLQFMSPNNYIDKQGKTMSTLCYGTRTKRVAQGTAASKIGSETGTGKK